MLLFWTISKNIMIKINIHKNLSIMLKVENIFITTTGKPEVIFHLKTANTILTKFIRHHISLSSIYNSSYKRSISQTLTLTNRTNVCKMVLNNTPKLRVSQMS